MPNPRISPPQSWKHPERHWVSVLQNSYYSELSKVQDCVHDATHSFFRSHGIRTLDFPLTTGSISSPMAVGSDSLPVEVELLGQTTYLVDSMQFLLELGCRLHRKGSCYKAVSFRGEDSDATHLQQFHHAEVEIPGGLEDILRLGASYVCHLSERLLDGCPDSILALAGSVGHVEHLVRRGGQIPRMTMEEAILELRGQEGCVKIHAAGFGTLTRRGEEVLVRSRGEGTALWITHFPALSVPFYQATVPQHPELAMNGDLLLGGREVLGCGQRHRTAADVRRSLEYHQVATAPYEWYVQMRDYDPMQTAGFGMGTERFLMWALRQDDIRDCTLLHRDSRTNCFP